MKYRLCAFERFTMEQKNIIDEDLNLTGHDRKELEKNLAENINFVKEINEKIFSLLKNKLDGFNVLTHLMDQDEITIYILDGKLLINNFKSTPN
ncbi:hypothetical protein QEK19_004368 [Klebsiella pneumoniae]|nr:hypothetical protein [Klebsiella pneumoniae]